MTFWVLDVVHYTGSSAVPCPSAFTEAEARQYGDGFLYWLKERGTEVEARDWREAQRLAEQAWKIRRLLERADAP